MREPRIQPISVISARGNFYVQSYDGRQFFYLGTDKLWHRDWRLCDPFTTREQADAAADKEGRREH